MDTRMQARQLAALLAPSLPRAVALHEPPDRSWSAALPLTNDLVTVAVLRELRRLAADELHLPSARTPSGDGAAPAALLQRLEGVLARPSSPSRELLWSLLAAGEVSEDAAPHLGVDGEPARAGAARWARHAWLRRQMAAAVVNGVVVLVVGVALVSRFGGSWRAWPQFGVLPLFAIWTLSFLPGWLFVRFIGQRAAALWWDFVLALHRLGVDEPEFLPEPPSTSVYHRRWLAAGGAVQSNARTIYHEKFDAYYGRSVSRVGAERDHGVGAETLFPVLLLTAVLAASWTAVLSETSFAQSPSTPVDMLKLGFLGAYAFIVQMLLRRYFQSDLKASAYVACLVRLFVVGILVVVLHELPELRSRPEVEAVVAFVVGFFPLVGMQALQRVAATALRTAVPSLTPAYPLSQLDGLNVWYEARLLEEGIEDMQNLATANLVDVLLHTHVPVGRLVDWVDQAHLYHHLDRAERGGLERWRANRTARSLPEDSGAQPTDHEASPAYRDGSRTRHALRLVGVRTATDLLKIMPGDAGAAPGLDWVGATGLDLRALSALAHVLAQEPGMNLLWNWQRGAMHVLSPPPR